MKTHGLNRTGATLAPELFTELVEATRDTQPSAPGGAEALAQVRIAYAEAAEPTGSIPGPSKAAGGTKATPAAMVLIDKLGERLAFERTGVRLYDALISKLDAYGSWDGGPSRAELEEIRADEQEHFLLLQRATMALGADPTAITPAADLQAVVAKGIPAALADPRTNLRDGLDAILVAELVDNDGWETLTDLARGLGHPELAEEFTEALEDEREHLGRVRTWLGAALGKSAGAETARLFEARARERELLLVTSAGLSAEPAGLTAMDEEEELPAQAPAKGGRLRAKPARRSAAKPAARGGAKARGAKARGGANAAAEGRAAAKPGRRAPKRAAGKSKSTSARKRSRPR